MKPSSGYIHWFNFFYHGWKYDPQFGHAESKSKIYRSTTLKCNLFPKITTYK